MSDLIRREDVAKTIQHICDICGEQKKYNGVMCGSCNLDSFIREYEDLPSAEPERKTGEWIDGMPYVNSHWKVCSECHVSAPDSCGGFNFCPNCGADMRGENGQA